MGMLEQIAADVAEIKEMLAAMNAPAGAAPKKESKPTEPKETAAQKKAREKAEKESAEKDDSSDGQEFTAEDVRQRFLAIQSKHGDDIAKGAIAGAGYKKLAELIADAENWDKSMAYSASILETGELPEDGDDNGGL